jgi:hypothetical protein
VEEKSSTSNAGQAKVFSSGRHANVVNGEIEMITTNLISNGGVAMKLHPEPNLITFTSPNDWVMRITADRRIEVNEDVAVTEAAQAIFDALERYWQKKPWVGLTGAEVNHIFAAYVGYPERMMTEVERLLKEKNT